MEIAVEHLVPALDGFVEQVHTMVGAGAVDEGVDMSPLLFDLSHETLGGLGPTRHSESRVHARHDSVIASAVALASASLVR